MKKTLLDKVRIYVLTEGEKKNPLSPMYVTADKLDMKKQDVSLALWYLQEEGLVGKYTPDGYKHAVWCRTPKALTIIESSQKQAEN